MQSLHDAFAPHRAKITEMAAYLSSPSLDDVWVLTHARPDEDCIGSGHALAYALTKMGKRAAVFCADSFDEKFDAVIAPTSLPAPASFVPRVCVAVDAASPAMFGEDFPYLERIGAAIDHHTVNKIPTDNKLVISEAAACGELIFALLLTMGIPFDTTLAHLLYTAISGDTGCFRYESTTAFTLSAAAYLYRYSTPAAFARLNRLFFEEKSQNRLSVEGYVLSHTVFLADGKIGLVALPQDVKATLSKDEKDFDQIANLAKQAKGAELGLVLHTLPDGKHKLSARSNRYFDCADFCAHFGGGGHVRAAGCTLSGDFSSLLENIKKIAIERMENCAHDGTFESE